MARLVPILTVSLQGYQPAQDALRLSTNVPDVSKRVGDVECGGLMCSATTQLARARQGLYPRPGSDAFESMAPSRVPWRGHVEIGSALPRGAQGLVDSLSLDLVVRFGLVCVLAKRVSRVSVT